jgi:hypothetical protein
MTLADRVAARYMSRMAKLVAPNSVKAKPFKTKAVVMGKGSYICEPVDGDDSFPPAIERYEVIDGWVFYHGTNGSEGVIAGSQRDLENWVRDVEQQKAVRSPNGKGRLWVPHDGGEHFVEAAVEAGERMLKHGGIHAEIRVWIQPGVQPSGEYQQNVLNLVNIHEGGTARMIGGITLPLGEQIAAHEAAHAVFSRVSRGRKVMEVLADREARNEDYLSAYHSLAGHFEGAMEAASLWLLAPGKLKAVARDVYDATQEWLS